MNPSKFFLIGLPGAGKTTYGQKLSQATEILFIDLDEVIVSNAGKAITTIFEEEGEDYFRELERKLLQEVINSNDAFILATGGGTPCFFDNIELMKESGLTIFINTPIETIQKRVESDTARPLLRNQNVGDLFELRKSCYEKADKTVTTFDELEALIS